jgi:hypothetical protein
MSLCLMISLNVSSRSLQRGDVEGNRRRWM